MNEKNEYLDRREMSDDKCFFCQNKESKRKRTGGDTWHYICPCCGEYEVTGSARQVILASPEYNKKLNQLASLSAERTLQRKGSFLLGTDTTPQNTMLNYEDFLKNYPSNFMEQHDRALLNLARLANFSPICAIDNRGKYPAVLFCDSPSKMLIFLKVLKNEGYVDFSEQILSGIRLMGSLFLTVEGFKYVRSLGKDISKRQHAFVAMWFHDEMKLYTQEVQKAIRQAGYEPYIANQDSYNGLIMDKVLNKISEARFVIADLTSLPEKDSCTGVRGGVYYEAGYAAGLGLQVILTCREDVTARIHFDLKQFLGIFWKETDDGKLTALGFDFVDFLKNHIIKTVGPGPYYGKDSNV